MRSSILGAGLLLSLTGCAGVPDIYDRDPLVKKENQKLEDAPLAPTVLNILDEIRCEIDGANDVIKDQRFAISVTLTLQVDESVGLTPSLTYIDPRTTSTSFSTLASGELSGTRRRSFALSYYLDSQAISELKVAAQETIHFMEATGSIEKSVEATNAKFMADALLKKLKPPKKLDINEIQAAMECDSSRRSADKNQEELGKKRLYKLNGDLGLREIIMDGVGATRKQRAEGIFYSSEAKTQAGQNYTPTFGSTIQFTVKKSISGLGPTWSLERFKGPSGANGLFNGNSLKTNILIITFAQARQDVDLSQEAFSEIESLVGADFKLPFPKPSSQDEFEANSNYASNAWEKVKEAASKGRTSKIEKAKADAEEAMKNAVSASQSLSNTLILQNLNLSR